MFAMPKNCNLIFIFILKFRRHFGDRFGFGELFGESFGDQISHGDNFFGGITSRKLP